MSLGGGVGAVLGGIVGYALAPFTGGGSLAIYYGVMLGFGIGMMIDPMTPDIPSVGEASSQETQTMSAEIGTVIPDLCGTAKITGHLLFFGAERVEEIIETPESGGKGGGDDPEPYVTGYKYFMSFGLGICACPDEPVYALYAVYENDDVEPVWEGELTLPVSGGMEWIYVSDYGYIYFSFGTSDQTANALIEPLISDSTLNTPYRNMCWAYFNDYYIGLYNRTPTFSFVIKKLPDGNDSGIGLYNVNPMSAIYYALNTLSGLPESWFDDTDFATAAATLRGERLGVSVLFDQQESALAYVEAINTHAENILLYGVDGKFHPKLIRDDYDIDTLLEVNESVMLDTPTISRGSWIDTVNEVKVQYTEILGATYSMIVYFPFLSTTTYFRYTNQPEDMLFDDLYGANIEEFDLDTDQPTIVTNIFSPDTETLLFGGWSSSSPIDYWSTVNGSTDGGDSLDFIYAFEQLVLQNGERGPSLMFNRSNGEIITLITGPDPNPVIGINTQVWATTDTVTWTIRGVIPFPFKDVVVGRECDDGTLLVGLWADRTTTGVGLYRSTNEGVSWTSNTLYYNICDICCCTGGIAMVSCQKYVDGGDVFVNLRSTDNGANWTETFTMDVSDVPNLPPETPDVIPLPDYHFFMKEANLFTIYTVLKVPLSMESDGDVYLYKSIDYGANWTFDYYEEGATNFVDTMLSLFLQYSWNVQYLNEWGGHAFAQKEGLMYSFINTPA